MVAYVVRTPQREDAAALGVLHVAAWQAAYRNGLMPDEYLDSLSADDRAETWLQALETEPRPRHRRYVADDESGQPIGFVVVGPADGDPDASVGEVYAINVDPDHWGRGAGTLLLEAGIAALTEEGFTTAVLWVHPNNERSRHFYETQNWSAEDVQRTEELFGVTVPEVRYRRRLG